MTIRSNVNIRAANDDYGHFLTGVEAAPAGVLVQGQTIADLIGDMANGIIRRAREEDLKVCNCDGIREIEALVFAMLRDKNPDSEIETAIGLGRTLTDFPNIAEQVMAILRSDPDYTDKLKLVGHNYEEIMKTLDKEKSVA